MKPDLSIVGYATATSASIFAAFRDNAAQRATLFIEENGALRARVTKPAKRFGDVCVYNFSASEIGALSPDENRRVRYGIVGHRADTSAAAPTANELRSLRLLPTDGPPRVALVSCNGPIKVEESRRYALWQQLVKLVDAGDVDMVIHAGDQIYADSIRERFLDGPSVGSLENDPELVKTLAFAFGEQYLRTFCAPAVSHVLGAIPNVMMWDDHEVYDGWGSNDGDARPDAQKYFAVASEAFDVFQGSHGPPRIGDASRAWGFVHADHAGKKLAVIALDGRTNRRYADKRLLGREQQRQFTSWLAANATGAEHLWVVLGVPPLHAEVAGALGVLEFTPWVEEPTDDLRDAWVAPNNREELRQLLLRLFEFAASSPTTQVSILAGDVHVGSLGSIVSELAAHKVPRRPTPMIHQIVSSGIGTSPPSGLSLALMRQVIGGEVVLVEPVVRGRLLRVGGDNILPRRNFAVIDVSDDAPSTWEKHGNVHVCFYAETDTGVRSIDHHLLRP